MFHASLFRNSWAQWIATVYANQSMASVSLDAEGRDDQLLHREHGKTTSRNRTDGHDRSTSNEVEVSKDLLAENSKEFPVSRCNRCKKDFTQIGPKSFKMCEHCRTLQRERTKRWQNAVKKKEGVCKRCGAGLTDEMTEGGKYVLCTNCREMLRSWKSNRHQEGKCVHCAGVNEDDSAYKVCNRCREKDKNRRLLLEKEGQCNKCSSVLNNDDKGFKVCAACRSRRKPYTSQNKLDLATQNKIIGKAKNILSKEDTEISFASTSAASTDKTIRSGKCIVAKKRASSAGDFKTKKKVRSSVTPENPRHEISLDGDVVEEIDNVINPEEYDNELEKYKSQLDQDMLLSEEFDLSHHDHSQLNQQLKKLTQFTRHSQHSMNGVGESPDANHTVEGENVSSTKYSDEVLVDLGDLAGIDIDYDMNRVIEDRQMDTKEVEVHNAEEEEDDDETMLQHVRAVQAGLLSNTAEPSDAELAAAVEAVAVAAAVANNRENEG